jgi:hypothetical protein
MRTRFLVCGILGVFCAVLGVFCIAVLFLRSLTEDDLYRKLDSSSESIQALEIILKNPDRYSAGILYVSANAAFAKKRLEDSAFLFYAAQLRTRFDAECFPPKGTGGNDPFLVHAALSQQLGSAINPAVMAEPKVFDRAIARLRKWSPKASRDYNPGYEFTQRRTEKDADQATTAKRTEFIDGMTELSTLLNDAEYFAAFQIVQAYHLTAGDKRPSQEAKDKAIETMKRIQKNKGLKGLSL